MFNISEVRAGNPILLIAFGIATEGTILHVDESINAIIYETEESQETLWLEAGPKSGGAYYEFAKHSASDTVFAYFKGYSSDKYVRY